MSFFLSKKNDERVSWEETERGKEFKEKVTREAEERARKNAEWEINTPPERKEQYKLFKIYFSIFFITFIVALFVGFNLGCPLPIFIGEAVIATISFVLFKIKPKNVKYPNCFMMPVIAIGCTFLFYLLFANQFKYFIHPQKTEINNEQSLTTSSDDDSYENFLKSNGIIPETELYDSKGD